MRLDGGNYESADFDHQCGGCCAHTGGRGRRASAQMMGGYGGGYGYMGGMMGAYGDGYGMMGGYGPGYYGHKRGYDDRHGYGPQYRSDGYGLQGYRGTYQRDPDN